MRLSRAKVNQLSRRIVDALIEIPGVTLLREPNSIRLSVVDIMLEELRKDDYLDRKVRQKIASQKRDLQEGGREWEILFRQYYREEFQKARPVR